MSQRLASRNVFRRRRLVAPVPSRKPVTKQQVRQMIDNDLEEKFWDTTYNAAVDFSGIIIPLTNIPQGVSDSMRVGDELKLKRCRIHYLCTPADNYNGLRFILFKLNDFTSGPAVSTYFTLTGSVQAPLGEVVWDQQHLVHVVSDRFAHVQSSTGEIALTGIIDVNLKGIVSYTGGSTTNQEGGLYLYVTSDSGAAPSPTFIMNARVVYLD